MATAAERSEDPVDEVAVLLEPRQETVATELLGGAREERGSAAVRDALQDESMRPVLERAAEDGGRYERAAVISGEPERAQEARGALPGLPGDALAPSAAAGVPSGAIAPPHGGGALQGHVDEAGDAGIEGWAWDPQAPGRRVRLELREDERQLATATAEMFRPDLALAGIGDGWHGFRIALPSALAAGPHLVQLRCLETGAVLPGSPVAIEVPSLDRVALPVPAGEAGPDTGSELGAAAATPAAAEGDGTAIPSAAASPAAGPALQGFIDKADYTGIQGWIWDPEAPRRRIRVELVEGDRQLATTVADLHRPGLDRAGIGDGRHVFKFDLPPGLLSTGPHVLHLRCLETGVALPASPIAIEVPDDWLLPPAPAVDRDPVAPPAMAPARSPALRMEFEILIPIWGASYVERFVELGLRSLLAPGNLPWLAGRHAVKVTALTTREGYELLRSYASFAELANFAETAFVEIEDLIASYGRNYSVILTRAYNRAMALSADLVGRNFIYLVGDQVFADGSLRTVAEAMQAGADACLACTPRVDADIVAPKLRDAGTATELVLANRDLAELVMRYPHPTAVAKIVRGDQVHLSVAHQFFWRPAPQTLVSRCFLLHMLCIRPTVRPRDIAAPCDFSFVTELAPGGRYHYLTDSDSFLSLELQGSLHETEFITSFGLGPADVAESISAWATPMHLDLVSETFLFRSGASRYTMRDAVAVSQPYIDRLVSHLAPPQDHRHHHFWLGAVGAEVLRPKSEDPAGGAELSPVLARLINAELERLTPLELGVCVSDQPTPVANILARNARRAVRISPDILYRKIEDVAAPGGTVLLVLNGRLADFIELFSDRNRVSRLLRVGGPGRVILLAYAVTIQDLRNSELSRQQLYRIFAAQLPLFTRFGIAPRIHDLAPLPVDRMQGFLIEMTAEAPTAGALGFAAPELPEASEDSLFGWREILG
jgi:hypothetical protein